MAIGNKVLGQLGRESENPHGAEGLLTESSQCLQGTGMLELMGIIT